MPSSTLSKFLPVRHEDAHAKRERRKEARPGELLDAALDLFVEKGFAATRSEEVAARAGVSKGTLFLYFPSKEELFKAVVRENISGRFKEWSDEFESFQGDSADMLRYCMKVWWDRLGAGRASGIYQQEVIVPGQDLIRRMLQRGIDRGEFHVADIDYAIYSLIAPMIFLIMMKHSIGACVPQGYPLDPERYIAAQIETLLHGFCVRPGDVPATGARA
jgi:TetR/AcrR family transcriptional regulator